MKDKVPDVYFVEWLDSASTSGWNFKDDIQTEPSVCQSVGFLVEETKTTITLALSISVTNENFAHCVAIPKFAIKRKKIVKL